MHRYRLFKSSSKMWTQMPLLTANLHRFVPVTTIQKAKCLHQMAHFEHHLVPYVSLQDIIVIHVLLQYCLLLLTGSRVKCSHFAPFSPGPKLEPRNFTFCVICMCTTRSSQILVAVHYLN